MRSIVAAVLTGLCVLSCSNPTSSNDSGYLQARITSAGLELSNRSTDAAYYFAADPDVLALADYVMCESPAMCPGVGAHQSVVVPLTDVAFYSASTRQVKITYWHFTAASGGTGYTATDLRESVVPVR